MAATVRRGSGRLGRSSACCTPGKSRLRLRMVWAYGLGLSRRFSKLGAPGITQSTPRGASIGMADWLLESFKSARTGDYPLA